MAAAVDDDESGTMKMLQFKTQQIVALMQDKRELEASLAEARAEADTGTQVHAELVQASSGACGYNRPCAHQ